MSIKYLFDEFYDNGYYARVAGLSLKELNSLERELFFLLQCRLYVSDEEYEKGAHFIEHYQSAPPPTSASTCASIVSGLPPTE